MLVGFTGLPGSGKTFSAHQMFVRYRYLGAKEDRIWNCSFSQKIKEITRKLFPEWNYEHIRGDLKEVIDKEHDISPRKVQQIIGRSLLEISPTLWSDVLFRELDHKNVSYRNSSTTLVTVDDVRYPQDFEAIKSRGGVMVGLIPGKGYKPLSDETMGYETEKHIKDLVNKCDHIFVNDFDSEHTTVIKDLTSRLWRFGE